MEIDFSYSVPGRETRFRVNAYFQRNGLGAAFRLIPAHIKGVDELILPAAIHKMAAKPRGFVVVTGPTGSGKSTALAAVIQEIEISLEEEHTKNDNRSPIEFLHRHNESIINQREVGD